MEAYRDAIVFGCVALYMVACIAIGLWAMRRTKTASDFFMAGRNLGFLVTGVAIFSSTMSGFGFVGGPGLMYRMGMSSVWIVAACPIGYCICFFLLGKRIRLFGELFDSISLPDVVAARYRSETSRLLSALAILIGVLAYLGSQILAMSQVLKGILDSMFANSAASEMATSEMAVGQSNGVPLALCAVIACAVLVFYCVTGGIIASVYTDLLQGLVMLVAAVLVFITAAMSVRGGFPEMAQTLAADDPESIGPWGTLGMIGCLSWFFVFALGLSGQPHVVSKMMMNRRLSDAKHILPLSIVGYAVAAMLWIGMGLAMRTQVLMGQHAPLPAADQAAHQFLHTYAHPVLAGVVIAGLFAAIMSTSDSFLNIAAAAIVHDIPRALIGRSLKRELLWARVATVALAVCAAVFGLMMGDLVALLGTLGWGIFAAALVPAVAVGFNWKRATPFAANVSIVAGVCVTVGSKMVEKFLGVSLPFGFNGGALALLVSLTLFLGVSLFSKPPRLDKDVEAVMDI